VGGSTAILVRRGTDHYATHHLEDSAPHVVLATRPVKVVAM
jgi:hypothetical protein